LKSFEKKKRKKGYLTGSVLEQQTEDGASNLLINMEPNRTDSLTGC